MTAAQQHRQGAHTGKARWYNRSLHTEKNLASVPRPISRKQRCWVRNIYRTACSVEAGTRGLHAGKSTFRRGHASNVEAGDAPTHKGQPGSLQKCSCLWEEGETRYLNALKWIEASQEPPPKWGRDLQKTKPSMCSYLSIAPPERAIKEETGSLEAWASTSSSATHSPYDLGEGS